MKKAIFILLLALTFQSSAQIKEGHYMSTVSSYVDFDSDGIPFNENAYIDTTYIQVSSHGFRLMYKLGDYGSFYPWSFVKRNEEGQYLYTVYLQDACKINLEKGYFIFYYNFNKETGFYDKATNYRKLKYLYE
tara:strand:+ start:5506 stop:5904 length:399 start_codon:yes stop_codon:yes gene_type:complete